MSSPWSQVTWECPPDQLDGQRRDACLARTERTLCTRWRAISFLVRVRYEDQPAPEQPAASHAGRSNGDKGRAPGELPGPEVRRQPG
jgi:hypothetical protein